MPQQRLANKNIRKIIKSGNGSYMATIPMEMVKKLKWQERQKIIFALRGKTITIKDWKK